MLIIHVTQYMRVSPIWGQKMIKPSREIRDGKSCGHVWQCFPQDRGTTVTMKCAATLAPDQPWSSNDLAFLSFSLVHIGISLSCDPLLGSSSLIDVPGIEMHNDYTSNTWICPYCKNSNTSDEVKAWLTSSVSPHATALLCRDYRYQFGVCSYLISVSTLNTKFCECKYNNWLVCCSLLSAQQTPKRSRETKITSMGNMHLGIWGTCVYILNCQNRIVKIVICFEV